MENKFHVRLCELRAVFAFLLSRPVASRSLSSALKPFAWAVCNPIQFWVMYIMTWRIFFSCISTPGIGDHPRTLVAENSHLIHSKSIRGGREITYWNSYPAVLLVPGSEWTHRMQSRTASAKQQHQKAGEEKTTGMVWERLNENHFKTVWYERGEWTI